MAKPVIVITAGKQAPPVAIKDPDAIIVGCDVEYLEAITLAEAVPIILPSVVDQESIQSVLMMADGVLLTGGGDIHAHLYGEEPHELSQRHDLERDAMEMAVARTAIKLNMPTLGICRGLQLLNVVMGGTLIQDIPSEVATTISHMPEDLHAVIFHQIRIEEDSLLARVMHSNIMEVNTWHHQAVKTLGSGLRISARADDGVIEGIESCEGKPILAIQCHPEVHAGTTPGFMTLFRWLVEKANAYHQQMHPSWL